MRKILLSVLFMFLSLKAFALQWSQVQGHLPGVPRDILAHPTNPSKLYLSTDKQLYENEKQKGWKRLFSVPGSHRIHTVYISALFPETLYVTSSKGLYVSKDAGHQWNLLFGGEGAAKEVISVCVDEQGRLWIGTVAGAFVWDERQSQWIPETGIPEVAIHQILSLPETKKTRFFNNPGNLLGRKGGLITRVACTS
jgi:ligand-binding sensor domain-containing protein